MNEREKANMIDMNEHEKANMIEELLSLKYDRDFWMTSRSWKDYVHSIGCSFSPLVVKCYQVEDPDSFHSSHTIGTVFVPVEVGFKVLVLGGFP